MPSVAKRIVIHAGVILCFASLVLAPVGAVIVWVRRMYHPGVRWTLTAFATLCVFAMVTAPSRAPSDAAKPVLSPAETDPTARHAPAGPTAPVAPERLDLKQAIAAGETEAARALLAENPALASKLIDGSWLPIVVHAIERPGSIEIIDILLEHGADINALDRQGQGNTALYFAAMMTTYRDPEVAARALQVVAVLLERNADPNQFGSEGSPPLHAAASAGSVEAIGLLLARGALIDGATSHGRTALHEAAGSDRVAAIARLLDAGADVNARYQENIHDPQRRITPLAVAEAHGMIAASRALRARGGRVEVAPWPAFKVVPLVSAGVIARMYADNGIAADQRFKGKRYLVYGTVDDVRSNLKGEPYVALVAGETRRQVQVFLRPGEATKAAALKAGQEAYIEAEIVGMSVNVMGRDGVLVTP